MKRNVTVAERLFVSGLGLILLFMLLHDWIPLGSLNDIQGIQSENTTSEIIQVTIFNTLSIGIVLVIVLLFIGKRYPIWARIWLVIHLGSILYGALVAWWIPYFYGAEAERVASFTVMFGDTHAFLPVMNGIVPNTVHVLFHLILIITWILSIYISVRKIDYGVTRTKKVAG